MKKSEALNTFTLGLVMDINPLVAPKDGVCNALNATLITMNGNENVLQNDMGNARVETAFLPEGYVPLGTTLLGGVIYIVSYNPLNKKCQIGSFPSPERNISSDEISDLKQKLTNDDFKFSGEENGALIYYLKKNLNEDLTFNPGDKFIVYGDNINSNYARLYDSDNYTEENVELVKNHTIKLDIGATTDSGKLIRFNDLKEYKISNKGDYHIFLYTGEAGQTPDLDDYRSLTSLPYNIFSSKISGSLALIAELVQFDNFNVELHNLFDIVDGHKSYNPTIEFNFSGDYPFVPKGVLCELTLIKEGKSVDTSNFDFEIVDDDLKNGLKKGGKEYTSKLTSLFSGTLFSKIKELASSGYFAQNERNGNYIIQYKFTPCMNWGPITYLSVSGLIDLDKLGTGYIDLNQWCYYNDENKCNLTWGLEIYEEEGYAVTDVSMNFNRLTSATTFETVKYSINKKSSYFGVFYDTLPIGSDYYKLDKLLKPNNLYLVKILVLYELLGLKEGATTKPLIREFYRWLYTNTVFNSHYVDTQDFKDLSLDFTPEFNIDHKSKFSEEIYRLYGTISTISEGLSDAEKNAAQSAESSLSAIQSDKAVSVSADVKIGLKKDYNTFYIDVDRNAFQISLDSNGFVAASSSTIKYTEREDPNLEDYLKSSGAIISNSEVSKYLLKNMLSIDMLKDLPTNIVVKGTIGTINFKDNVFNIPINYRTLQTVKAYCTKVPSKLVHNGRFVPLAYNKDTFLNYNLEWDTTVGGGKWLPFTLGLFGVREDGGHDGRVWIGGWSIGRDATNELVEKGDNVDLHWTSDPDIANAEQRHGWTNTAMFFALAWGGDAEDGLTNWSGGRYTQPIEKTTANNRLLLAFRSNNDNYFHPINCSLNGSANKNVSNLRTSSTYYQLYLDFALFLNNIYRYDSESVSQSCIIPNEVLWMDSCTYTTTMSFTVIPGTSFNSSLIKLNLDSGSVSLSDLIPKFQGLGVLGGELDSLKNNINYKINPAETSAKLNIVDYNNTYGIEMRNHMLDQTNVTLDSIIMDYDGTTLLNSVSTRADKKMLYMRVDRDTGVDMVSATKFYPKKISYTLLGNEVKPLGSTTVLDSLGLNLNRYFTLDDNSLLVLKDPNRSEHSFKRDVGSQGDTGTADGYLKLAILSKYKSY